MTVQQLDLFDHVAEAYLHPASGRLRNSELYKLASSRAGITSNDMAGKVAIGRAAVERSPLKRKIRWHQQTLKHLGILRRVPGEHGVWELTDQGRAKLRMIRTGIGVLACSTDLGVAIWSQAQTVFGCLDEPIFLALTSPPYPLRKPRDYGNPPLEEYIDFVCRMVEPICRNLVPGGNVALSLSNDIFEAGSPARSIYLERLTIALHDRLGLQLMDRLVWASNKPPGPVRWASITRQQLNVGYEPILWFCNDPVRCIADNRRVLEPHTEKHLSFVAKGGVRTGAVHADGAYRTRPGSYARPTEGKIPRNVLGISNVCPSQRQYKKQARAHGLQPHGAPMPLALARKLVRFLSDVGQLVVDMCAGSLTTPVACELEGRRWIATEPVFDYVRGGCERLVWADGYDLALDLGHGC